MPRPIEAAATVRQWMCDRLAYEDDASVASVLRELIRATDPARAYVLATERREAGELADKTAGAITAQENMWRAAGWIADKRAVTPLDIATLLAGLAVAYGFACGGWAPALMRMVGVL